MIANVCMACGRSAACRRPSCPIAGKSWKAPLVGAISAATAQVGPRDVVVMTNYEDPFSACADDDWDDALIDPNED